MIGHDIVPTLDVKGGDFLLPDFRNGFIVDVPMLFYNETSDVDFEKLKVWSTFYIDGPNRQGSICYFLSLDPRAFSSRHSQKDNDCLRTVSVNVDHTMIKYSRFAKTELSRLPNIRKSELPINGIQLQFVK